MSHRRGCAGQRPETSETSAAAGDRAAPGRGQGSGQPPRRAAAGPGQPNVPWHWIAEASRGRADGWSGDGRGGVVKMGGPGGEALAVGGGAEPVVGFETPGEAALVWPADRAPDA